MGKMAKMEKSGEKWGGLGGGDSGHSTRDVGYGGLWRDLVEENGTKMGENIRKNFQSRFSHFFWRLKIFPQFPL